MEVEYFYTERMWDDVLNKPKQRNVFRAFREDIIIVGIEYDNDTERKVMSDTIAGVASKEDNILNTTHKKLTYSEAVRMVSGKNKLTSTHQPQECVEAHKKNTTRQINRNQYHEYGRGTTRCITGNAITLSHIRF